MQKYDKEKISSQWKLLVDGHSVNPDYVRPEILKSWYYSKKKGIDANCSMVCFHDPDLLLKRSHELITAAQPFMKMINEVIAGSGLRIDCIDHEGYFLFVF